MKLRRVLAMVMAATMTVTSVPMNTISALASDVAVSDEIIEDSSPDEDEEMLLEEPEAADSEDGLAQEEADGEASDGMIVDDIFDIVEDEVLEEETEEQAPEQEESAQAETEAAETTGENREDPESIFEEKDIDGNELYAEPSTEYDEETGYNLLTKDVMNNAKELKIGETDDLQLKADTVQYYTITVEKEGTYIFTSESIRTGSEDEGYEDDDYGYLYDSNGRELTHDDDGANDGNCQFLISRSLQPGTYYFAVKMYSKNTKGHLLVKTLEQKIVSEILSVDFPREGQEIVAGYSYQQPGDSTIIRYKYEGSDEVYECSLNGQDEFRTRFSSTLTDKDGNWIYNRYLEEGQYTLTVYQNGVSSTNVSKTVTFEVINAKTYFANHPDHAISQGQEVTFAGVNGNYQYYSFTADKSALKRFTFKNLPDDVYIDIMDGSNELTGFRGNGNDSLDQNIALELDQGSQYVLIVRPDTDRDVLAYGSVIVNDGVKPLSMTASVPQQFIYGEQFTGIEVTAHYSEDGSIPDETFELITGDDGYTRDSYGNGFSFDVNYVVGKTSIEINCTSLEMQTYPTTIISRLSAGYGKDQRIALPNSIDAEPATLNIQAKTELSEYGGITPTAQYYQVDVSAKADFLFALDDMDEGYASVSLYNEDEESQLSNYNDDGAGLYEGGSKRVSLTSGTYLLCVYATGNTTLTVSQTAAVTELTLNQSSDETVTDHITEIFTYENYWDMIEYMYAHITLSDGTTIVQCLDGSSRDVVSLAVSFFDSENNEVDREDMAESKVYTMRVSCGSVYADLRIKRISEYDLYLEQATVLIEGDYSDNPIQAEETYDTRYVKFTAPEDGTYFFANTDRSNCYWINSDTDDDTSSEFPTLRKLDAGQTVLIQTYITDSDYLNNQGIYVRNIKDIPKADLTGRTKYSAKQNNVLVVTADQNTLCIFSKRDSSEAMRLYTDDTYTWVNDGSTIQAGPKKKVLYMNKESCDDSDEDAAFSMKEMKNLSVGQTMLQEEDFSPLEEYSSAYGYFIFKIPTEGTGTYSISMPGRSSDNNFNSWGYVYEINDEGDSQRYIGSISSSGSSILSAEPGSTLMIELNYNKYNYNREANWENIYTVITEKTAPTDVNVSLNKEKYTLLLDDIGAGSMASEVHVTYTYPDENGEEKQYELTGENSDENGFKISPSHIFYRDTGGNEISIGDIPEERQYYLRVIFAGKTYDLPFTVQKPDLTEAQPITADGTLYDLSANSTKLWSFTVETDGEYYFVPGTYTREALYDAETLERITYSYTGSYDDYGKLSAGSYYLNTTEWSGSDGKFYLWRTQEMTAGKNDLPTVDTEGYRKYFRYALNISEEEAGTYRFEMPAKRNGYWQGVIRDSESNDICSLNSGVSYAATLDKGSYQLVLEYYHYSSEPETGDSSEPAADDGQDYLEIKKILSPKDLEVKMTKTVFSIMTEDLYENSLRSYLQAEYDYADEDGETTHYTTSAGSDDVNGFTFDRVSLYRTDENGSREYLFNGIEEPGEYTFEAYFLGKKYEFQITVSRPSDEEIITIEDRAEYTIAKGESQLFRLDALNGYYDLESTEYIHRTYFTEDYRYDGGSSSSYDSIRTQQGDYYIRVDVPEDASEDAVFTVKKVPYLTEGTNDLTAKGTYRYEFAVPAGTGKVDYRITLNEGFRANVTDENYNTYATAGKEGTVVTLEQGTLYILVVRTNSGAIIDGTEGAILTLVQEPYSLTSVELVGNTQWMAPYVPSASDLTVQYSLSNGETYTVSGGQIDERGYGISRVSIIDNNYNNSDYTTAGDYTLRYMFAGQWYEQSISISPIEGNLQTFSSGEFKDAEVKGCWYEFHASEGNYFTYYDARAFRIMSDTDGTPVEWENDQTTGLTYYHLGDGTYYVYAAGYEGKQSVFQLLNREDCRMTVGEYSISQLRYGNYYYSLTVPEDGYYLITGNMDGNTYLYDENLNSISDSDKLQAGKTYYLGVYMYAGSDDISVMTGTVAIHTVNVPYITYASFSRDKYRAQIDYPTPDDLYVQYQYIDEYGYRQYGTVERGEAVENYAGENITKEDFGIFDEKGNRLTKEQITEGGTYTYRYYVMGHMYTIPVNYVAIDLENLDALPLNTGFECENDTRDIYALTVEEAQDFVFDSVDAYNWAESGYTVTVLDSELNTVAEYDSNLEAVNKNVLSLKAGSYYVQFDNKTGYTKKFLVYPLTALTEGENNVAAPSGGDLSKLYRFNFSDEGTPQVFTFAPADSSVYVYLNNTDNYSDVLINNDNNNSVSMGLHPNTDYVIEVYFPSEESTTLTVTREATPKNLKVELTDRTYWSGFNTLRAGDVVVSYQNEDDSETEVYLNGIGTSYVWWKLTRTEDGAEYDLGDKLPAGNYALEVTVPGSTVTRYFTVEEPTWHELTGMDLINDLVAGDNQDNFYRYTATTDQWFTLACEQENVYAEFAFVNTDEELPSWYYSNNYYSEQTVSLNKGETVLLHLTTQAENANIAFRPQELAINLELTDPEATYIWDGNEHTPEFRVVDQNGIEMTDEYISVSITDNVEPGFGYISVTGTGIYQCLSTSREFYIGRKSILTSDDIEVHWTEKDFTYDGYAHIPFVEVLENGIPLSSENYYLTVYEDTLYQSEISEYSCVNAGAYGVILHGGGNHYDGIVESTFLINQKNLGDEDIRVSSIPAEQYTGEALTPELYLYQGDIALIEDTDYDLEYANNTEPGTATITVTGKGNFTGSREITFDILEPKVAVSETSPQALDGNYSMPGQPYEQWYSVTADGTTRIVIDLDGTNVSESRFYILSDDGEWWMACDEALKEKDDYYDEYHYEYTLESGKTAAIFVPMETYLKAYISKSLKPNSTVTVDTDRTSGELQWYALTAEKDWQYQIKSTEAVTATIYDADGDYYRYAGNNDTFDLGLTAGQYYLTLEPAAGTADVTLTLPEAPEKIKRVTATPQIRAINVSWERGNSLDTRYRVYRENAAGVFEKIADIYDVETTYYLDENLDPAVTYNYYVTGVYGEYAEGDPSDTASAQPDQDTVNPVISSVTPLSETRHAGIIPITATATDNIEVAKMSVSIRTYKADQADDEGWEVLKESESGYLNASWNTTAGEGYPDGVYDIKVEAWDSTGNAANKQVLRYEIDNSGPEKVTGLSEEHTTVTIALHWSKTKDEDLTYFYVEELQEDGSWEYAVRADSLGYEFTGLTPDTEHTYRVVGFDDLGNRGTESDSITVSTDVDTTIPVIKKNSDSSSEHMYSKAVPFSVTAQDDYQITEIWFEYCRDKMPTESTEWTVLEDTRITYNNIQRERSYTKDVDVSGMEEGVLTLRARAKDAYDNVSNGGSDAPFIQVYVDHTAPAAPTGLNKKFYGKDVVVTWNQNEEDDVSYFILTRVDPETGKETELMSAAQLAYRDNGTDYEQSYQYYLRAVDFAGNISDMSQILEVTVPADKEKPVVQYIIPTPGETISPTQELKVYVTDNSRIRTVSTSYGEDGSSWTNAEQIALDSTKSVVTLNVTGENISGNKLYVKVTAEDYSGNVSETLSAEFNIDRIAPAASDIKAEQVENGYVDVTWKSACEEDLAGFYVYRRVEGTEDWSCISQRAAKADQIDYSATDKNVTEGVTLEYKVRAFDQCQNYTDTEIVEVVIPEGSVAEPKDEQKPYAYITANQICETGKEYLYSASSSWDNSGKIASYLWDFGDGTTSNEVSPRHTYAENGYYKITLTVTDPSGNEGTTELEVQSLTKGELGTVSVKVLDKEGYVVPEAGVYFDLGTEHMNILTTDGGGSVVFTAMSGTYPIGAYKDGYLPVKQSVNVAANAVTYVTLTMEEKDIVTGTLEATRMTLDEIIAAGINIDDPANQNFFKFTIVLTYGDQPLEVEAVCDDEGNTVGQDWWHWKIDDDDVDLHIIDWIPDPGPGGGGGGGGIHLATAPKPVIAILEIPGEASWLKDFFDVKLTIKNEASEDFFLDDCVATLMSEPATGLTLMDSNYTKADPVVEMGTIRGQETKTANWILRGDDPGEYNLSADFDAVLRDFGAEIHRNFETSEPIEVRDGSDLWLDIVTESDILENTDGAIRVGFRNESSYAVNCPKVTLQKVHAIKTYKTAGNSVVDTRQDVLEPGEELWTDYLIYRSDWTELMENENSQFYLWSQVLNKLSGMDMQVSFSTVPAMTIGAGRIEVYTMDDKSNQVRLIDIPKDSFISATVPKLMIKTYGYDPDGKDVPQSMDVVVKDGYLMSQLKDDDPNKNGYVITTDANGIGYIDSYQITNWLPGWGDDKDDNKFNYKAYDINLYARRATAKIPVVARGASASTGMLKLNVLGKKLDGTKARLKNATIIINGFEDQKTGKKGIVEYRGIDQGQHEVTIKAKGYETTRILIKVGEDTEETITLEPGDDTKRSHVTGISNTMTDNTLGNMVIIPETTFEGDATFTLERKLVDGEQFDHYTARITRANGKTEDFQFVDNKFTMDMTSMQKNDRLSFAVTVTVDGYEEGDEDYYYTSRFRDANIYVVEKPDFLGDLTGNLTKNAAELLGKHKMTLEGNAFMKFVFGELKKDEYSVGMDASEFVGSEASVKGGKVEYITSLMKYYSYDVERNSEYFPFTADYDLAKGKLTINMTVYNSDESKTNKATLNATTWTEDGMVSMDIASQKGKKRNTTGEITFSFEFSYDQVKNRWYLTIYGKMAGKVKVKLAELDLAGVGYAKADFTGSGSMKVQFLKTAISGTDTMDELTETFSFKEGKIGGEFKASAGGMLGTTDVASIGLYGKLGLTTQFFPYFKVDATSEIGWEGNILWFKHEDDLYNNTFNLYSATGTSSHAPRRPYATAATALMSGGALPAAEEAEQEYLIDEEMPAESMEENTRLLAADAEQSVSEWVNDENTLVRGNYYKSEQQTVTLADGRTMMVYVDFSEAKDASNPVNLYYTVYDKASGWSAPKTVVVKGTEGTVAINPSLSEQNGKVQLTWMNMKDQLQNLSSIDYGDMASMIYANMTVRSAVYDPANDTWIAGRNLNSGSIVTDPVSASGDSGEMTLWISNTGNTDTPTESYPDVIKYSTDGETVYTLTLDGIKEYHEFDITALAVEETDGGYDIAVQTLVPVGDELETHLYTNAFRNNNWQGFTAIDTNGASIGAQVSIGGFIYYTQGERLLRTDMRGNGMKQVTLSDTLKRVSEIAAAPYGSNGVILSWVDQDNESVIYAIASKDGNVFGEPFIVTSGEGTVGTPKITEVSNGWLFVYQQGISDGTTGLSYSMNTARVYTSQDLFIESTDTPGYMYPTQNVTTSFAVGNRGMGSTSARAVISAKEDGSDPLSEVNVKGVNGIIKWTVPATYDGEPYYLVLVPTEGTEDGNTADNFVRIGNDLLDLQLGNATYIGSNDDGASLKLHIINNSTQKCESPVLSIVDTETEEEIYSADLDTIEAGAEIDKELTIELPEKEADEDGEIVRGLLISISGFETEENLDNNQTLLSFEEKDLTEEEVDVERPSYGNVGAFVNGSIYEGNNVTWTIAQEGEENVLTLTGSGETATYESEQALWYSQREEITSIVVDEGITTLGADLFEGFTALKTVSLPVSLTKDGIDAAAFAGSGLKRETEEQAAEQTEITYAGTLYQWYLMTGSKNSQQLMAGSKLTCAPFSEEVLAAVKNVEDQVNGLNIEKPNDTDLKAAQADYDALTDEELFLVTEATTTALTTAWENKRTIDNAAVKAVTDQIEALNAETPNDEALAQIHADIEALTEDQTELYNKNAEAVAKVQTADENKARIDREAAEAVKTAIEAISEEAPTDQAIRDAENAYDGLTADQKKLFEGDDLKTAKETLDGFVADADAADAAEQKIEAISDDTPTDAAINDAKTTYDALNDRSKKLVDSGDVTKLENAVTEQTAAHEAIKLMEALDAATDKPDDAAIHTAEDTYKGLSAFAQKLVTDDAKANLDAAIANKAKIDRAAADAVSGKISEIKADAPTDEAIRTAQEAYGKLTEDQKKLFDTVDELKEQKAALEGFVEDADAADAAEKLIEKISDSDPTNADITAARDAYGKLTDGQKKLVAADDVTKLEIAAENQDKAAEVTQTIMDLSAEADQLDDAAIHAAEKAYDDLTDIQKKLVEKETTDHLDEVEAVKSEVDKSAADAVNSLITAINPDAPTDEAIRAAQEAFGKLTDDQKALFEEGDLKDQKAALDAFIADADAADAAERLIEKISDTEPTNADITAAREAYGKLTERQLKLVAGADVTKLTEAADDQDKAAEVAETLKALVSDADQLDDAAIHAAEAAYAGLTEIQKKLVETDAAEHLAEVQQVKNEVDHAAAKAVSELITAINAEAPTDEAIREAEEAFGKLTDDQKALFDQDDLKDQKTALEGYVADAEAADAAEKLIEKISDTDPTNEDITAAKESYDKLTLVQQKLVKADDVTKLNAAVEDQKKAATVTETLAALSSEALDDTAIHAAEAAYEALAPVQKKLVDKAATDHLAEVQQVKAEADLAAAEAAKAVIEKIDADAPTNEQIRDAAKAYANLTTDQKKLFDTVDDLKPAKEKLSSFIEDAEAADAVTALIGKIDVDVPTSTAINAAKEAYDKLDDLQKILVDTEAEEKLNTAVAAQTAAQNAAALMSALNTDTPDDAAIKAAQKAYSELNDIAKKLVDAESAEAKANMDAALAKKAEVDQAAAEAVKEQIAAITDEDVTKEAVKAASDAYDKLTEDQKALFSEQDALKEQKDRLEKYTDDVKKADEAAALIDQISDTDPTNETITAARDAFKALSETQAKLVDTAKAEKLTEAAGNQDKAAEVAETLKKLSTDTPDDDAIKAAEAAYEALSPAQQKLVEAEAKANLEAAEAKKAEVDKAAVDAVKAKIDALSEEAASDSAIIEAAEAAAGLTADQQKLFTEQEDYEALQNKLNDFVAAAEEAAKVEELINKISETEPSEADINAAAEAYNNLSPMQQKLVDAEETDKINQAVADQTAAHKAEELMKSLDTETPDDAAIKAAQEAYNGLSEFGKSLVSSEASEKLTEAEAAKETADSAAATAAEAAITDELNKVDTTGTSDDQVNSNKDAIKAAQDAYDALTPDQQAKVDADPSGIKAKLDQAVENVNEAEKVEALINGINENDLTNESITAAANAYDKLSDDQKKLVTAAGTSKLNRVEGYQRAAQDASGKMTALSTTLPDANAIAAAKAAYEALSPAEKSLVPQQAVSQLMVAEAKKAEIDAAAAKAAADAAAAAAAAAEEASKGIAVGAAAVVGGITYQATADGGVIITKGINQKTVTIPATVNINNKDYPVIGVGANAFKSMKKLVTLTIGANVKTIGKNAFAKCPKLKKVKGGNGLVSIAAGAFSGNKVLSSFTINSAVLETIGSKCFSGDKKLKTVKITKTKALKSVKKAFKGSSVTKVDVVNSKKKAYKKMFSKAGRKITLK